ncbi:MAG: type II toxin-antitoxin system RelE/ParE family toxin [Thermomonas sp.]|jgi:plasmid stabilization system protein ParE|uniref:type II toxin-antitoxin system RelE/ParE family toxin n=1 Tax=Thermomonas sp. TaxID=1971895 RepID=UPI001EBB0758|nr:type II toxin-antitoxin system RelE/ParE family toxin [Thermomonas sp.]MBV2208988.1 type II toxin-antitoxin system RelE/ParE family toxin [Thermomonas sp.]
MYRVQISGNAQDDLERLVVFLAEHDFSAALRARESIEKAYTLLADFPMSCRRADSDHPLLRELLVPFGHAGYVLLFEITSKDTVTILAVRHQSEEDYY